MTNRKLGWYWVKFDVDEKNGWECAEWNGATWEATCADYDWPEYMVEEVGQRIPTPDEDCKTAYLRAVDEMRIASKIGTADREDDIEEARRKLRELIDWHVTVATDERVNGGYRLVPATPRR